MLTDFLLDHQWIAPTILALLIALGPLMGSGLVDRTRVAWWLAGASMVPIVVLTLVPQNRRLYSRCEIALDWITNTMGAIIGAALGWGALRLAHRRATAR